MPSPFWTWFLSLMIATLPVSQCWATKPPMRAMDEPREDERALARFWVDGSLANRDGFDFLTCRFTIAKRRVNTVKDAIEGNWEPAERAQCLMILDGKKLRYELAYDSVRAEDIRERAIEKARAAGQDMAAIAMPFQSTKFLTDGSYSLSWYTELNKGSIWSPDQTPVDNLVVPLDSDVPGVAVSPNIRMLEDALAGKFPYVIVRVAPLRSPELQGVTVKAETQKSTIAFDVSKGYLPIYASHEYAAANVVSEHHVTRARHTDKGWFPIRRISVLKSEKGMLATELVVTELDVANRPDPGQFVIDKLPGGALVKQPNTLSAIRLGKERQIGLAELPALEKRAQETLAKRLADPDFDDGVASGTRAALATVPTWFWVQLAIVIGAVVCFALWKIRKRLSAGLRQTNDAAPDPS